MVFGVENFKASFAEYKEEEFRRAASETISKFPNLKVIVTTLRDVKSASCHDLSAVCFADDKVFKADDLADLEVLARVGSGDAFAAGLIYGIITKNELLFL